MTANPAGTVTFLFTDIENSTRLAREHPESWEAAKSRHHAILHEAIEQNDGFVFQIIGDAFCAAFHKAGDALKAAIKAQQDLQNEPWGEFTIYVRMGIHTGEAELDGNEYRGYTTLSFVQRLMSAGHGGQILVSHTSENLLREQLPEETRLRDMGMQKFAGVPSSQRVFQVIASDLPTEFPSLRTVDNLPNNLPTQLTSFVGREKELVDVKRLLQNTHLLTLIGPGGTGKTRLSTQAASEVLDQYPDGVWFVELAPILDPLLVPRTTAIAIGLRDEPQRPVIDMLCDYLREKRMLIVLDNCEHLVDACARMADHILHAAPDARILASSREGLGIAGEVTYRVPSLALPDLSHLPTVESLSQYEAVKLFIDRATAAVPTFAVTNDNAPPLAQVCHQLDGIPLALELAAAKIRVLSVEQIAKRLDDRFRLLTSGSRTALERHQTLRAAIDWSYNLLSPAEQVLFGRLSVFVGGWTLEAAESVCSDETVKSDDVLDLLEQLINKSLVITEQRESELRYHMLETIRQYANEKLTESSEDATIHEKHLDYYMQLAEEIEEGLKTAGQALAMQQLESEFDNFRMAWTWSLGGTTSKNCEKGLRLANAIDWDNHLEEGLNWLQRGLAQIERGNPKSDLIRAKALMRAGRLIRTSHDSETAGILLEESLALYRAINPTDKRDWTMLLTQLAYAFIDSDLSVARNFAQDGVNMGRALGQAGKWELGWALYWEGCVSYRLNDDKTARARVQEGLTIFRHMSNYFSSAAMLQLLAWIEEKAENYDVARSKAEEAQRIYLSLGLKTYAMMVLRDIAGADRQAGRYETAQLGFEELVHYDQERGDKVGLIYSLWELGETMSKLGKYEQAAGHLRESLHLLQPTKDSRFKGYGIFSLAKVLHHQGNSKSAACLLGAIELETHKDVWKLNTQRIADYIQSVESIKTALDEESYKAAWEAGHQMSLDEAVDFALQTVDETNEIKLSPATERAIPANLPSQREAEKQKYGGLTTREREVAAQIAQGKSNQAIAAELFVGLKTVEAHVTRILSKLGFTSRAQIAGWAVARGLAEAQQDLDTLGKKG